MTPEIGRAQNAGPSKNPAPLQGVTRAALYARVSDANQAKEGAIESQVLALKEQIAAAGHVLAKEYIDNGFSGPRFDRPALEEMRRDLKTDAFDIIYFHQADRIAREVVIQTIIIEEILKHRKRLVINGKDYEKNPENHFTMQALGSGVMWQEMLLVQHILPETDAHEVQENSRQQNVTRQSQ